MWGALRRVTWPCASALVAGTATHTLNSSTHILTEDKPPPPYYTRAQIQEHTTPDKRIWVTFKDGVYDITDFVKNHPGGHDKIMLAAGKAIDPFWRIYQAHLNSGLATNLLKDMRVGSLDPNEPPTVIDCADPYAADPERHPGLIFHNDKPCNAELPAALQMTDYITPNGLWFIRHHHPVPMINASEWRLGVGGTAVKALSLSIEDIKDRFPKTEITTTIQCGGNRRAGMDAVEQTAGISWGTGAISTACWGGVLLRDVLVYSGLLTAKTARAAGVQHIIFKGADNMEASIPVEKALGEWGDTLLAYEMNGQPLPPEHGYPLRAVVPGHVGVRNVKWVMQVVASSEEAEGPWQRGIAYKGFSPNVKTFEGIDVESILSMQEMPVQSVIVSPVDGQKVELEPEPEGAQAPSDDNTISMAGWAWSGGGRSIVRVDVSADGGQTWHTAELGDGKDQPPNRAWAWTFWEAEVPAPKGSLAAGSVELCCKATDASYNVQPERAKPFWNKRGLNNTAWHRVVVKAVESEEEE